MKTKSGPLKEWSTAKSQFSLHWEKGENGTENISTIWLYPKLQRARIKREDAEPFRSQLFRYIDETDCRWPNERFWHRPQGHQAQNTELKRYPILQKYLHGIRSFPSGQKPKRRRSGQDWILFPPRVDSFSEDTMLKPLRDLLSEKKGHYCARRTGFDRLCLIVYYNLAVLYNSPVETPHFKFEDVVDAAKGIVGDDAKPFDTLSLFIAVEGGRVLKIV